MNRGSKVLTFALVAVSSAYWIVQAGSLEPSGPAAPTMKTLEDVEPRTGLRNLFNALTPIVIDQPGSYYLSEDIFAFFDAHGIRITASNVTLDLNGFTVYGNTEVGSWDGIHADVSLDNITIKNGTVQDFFQDGIEAQGDNTRILNVRAVNNFQVGIFTGFFSIVRESAAINSGGHGIDTGAASVITHSVAFSNGGDGIVAPGSTVSFSTARQNGDNGIWVNAGAVVRGCVAVSNTGDGIDAEASLVQGNSAEFNGGMPINASGGATVLDNHI